MSTFNAHTEFNDVADSIESKAEMLRKELGILDVFPVPVSKIAAFRGFDCFEFPPSKDSEIVSGMVDHIQKKIYVNKQDVNVRKRFTIAHELGHIELHGANQNYIDYRRESDANDPRELEADHFAGCLLMPEKKYKEKWKELKGNIVEIAKFFAVSTQAAWMRGKKLGIM